MIHTEDVVIASDGARRFDGHFARPAAGAGPGLLIFSEMWGVATKKREMADDYARRGWCAIAPNMFWRSEFTGVVPFDQADKAWQRLQAFDFDKSADDCRTAVQWLRASPHCNGKIAAIGFCMGGRIAFLAASRAGVDAAIGLYALGIAKHLDEVRKMAVPLQLHYGLGRRAHSEIRDRHGRRCRCRQRQYRDSALPRRRTRLLQPDIFARGREGGRDRDRSHRPVSGSLQIDCSIASIRSPASFAAAAS